MANFCLTPAAIDKFRTGLKTGDVDPAKLSQMSSEERNKFFEDYVGKPNAKDVNALFESKLLLKNQQQGMITWAKNVAGLKETARTDLISKIGRMQNVLDPEDKQAFLKDLASQKLGVGVTQDEAKQIAGLSKRVEAARQDTNRSSVNDFLSNRRGWKPNASDMEYGRSKVSLANYVNGLKVDAQKLNFKDNPLAAAGQAVKRIPGEAKAINASMDDSAIFRQGWKTLLTHPGIWQKNARASFGNLVKQFGGKNVMDETNAYIYSHPLYDEAVKGKLAVGNLEEAFPTTAPEKVPILGRAYKASEAAYTAFVQKTRMDVFAKYYQIADKSGVNVKDEAELKSIGKLVNSLTGRGSLGSLEPIGNKVNNVFFSPRFIKGNIDTLTHPFGVDIAGGKVTPFARKQAAKNLVKIVSGTSAIITIANAVKPGSVELDPRSSDFGKIKVGDTRFDVTGGMASLVTLASRLATSSSKSTTTGQVTKLNSGKFGAETDLDVFNDFIENKLSPFPSAIKDLMTGQNSNTGGKATPGNEIGNLVSPIGLQNYESMKGDPNAANSLLTVIVDGLGINSNTYKPATQSGQSAWLTSTSKAITQFKSKVGATEFNQAANEQNTKLNQFLNEVKKNKQYQALPQSDQQKVITEEKAKLQKDIFQQHNFQYKEQKSNSAQLKKFLTTAASSKVQPPHDYTVPKGATPKIIGKSKNGAPIYEWVNPKGKPVSLIPKPYSGNDDQQLADRTAGMSAKQFDKYIMSHPTGITQKQYSAKGLAKSFKSLKITPTDQAASASIVSQIVRDTEKALVGKGSTIKPYGGF